MNSTKTLMANKPQAYLEATSDLLDNMYLSNVKKRLRQLNQPSKNDMRRWVWELIQNAKDSIVNNPDRSTVDIRIIIEGETVKFMHNGEPFTPKAQLGLLYKYSQDKDNTQSTGRFGTGFLTTHCLSKIVTIEGDMFEDNSCQKSCGFSVTMYRDGLLDRELLDGIKRMKDSLTFYNETYGWTTYTYEVRTETGRESLRLGIENFYDNIAQTMLFCPQLNSVVLQDNDRTVTIERHPIVMIGEGMGKASFTIKTDTESAVRSFVFTKSCTYNESLSNRYKTERNIRLTMAVEVDENNELVAGKEAATHLYCALPLVGTEDQITEPVYIDCPDFEPDEERQRLLLDGSETTERTIVDELTEVATNETVISECGINRLIYGEITQLYDKLVAFLSLENFGNLYYLADGLKAVKDYQDLNKEWYVEHVTNQYRAVLEKYPVVKTNWAEAGLKKLAEVIFVKEAKEAKDEKTEKEGKLYRLLKYLYPEKLIDADIQREWSIRAWKGLEIWGIKDLCADIEAYGNWNKINLVNIILKDWYNSFLELAVEEGSDVLVEYSLLPNIHGDLLSANTEDFAQNIGVSEIVLNIISGLGLDLRSRLLHSDILSVKLPRECNTTSYSAKINQLVKGVLDTNGLSCADVLQKLSPLYNIFQCNGQWEEDFKNKRQHIWYMLSGLYPQTFSTATIQIEDHILKSAFDAADNWVVPHIMAKIQSYENLSNCPTTLNWLNASLGYLAELASMSFAEYKVVPNQNGIFHKRGELCADFAIPSVLKAEILKEIGLDFKSTLLHASIDATTIGITAGMDVSSVATIIDKSIKDLKQKNDRVALYILSIMPQNRDSGLYRQQALLWELAKKHYPTECFEVDSHSTLDYASETLWCYASRQIRDKIVSEVQESKNLDSYNQYLNGKSDETIQVLNMLYSYLVQVNFDYKNLSIVPNQVGVFKTMSELKADNGKICDLAKDASTLLLEEALQFRSVLANTEVRPAPSTIYDVETAFGLLDREVMEQYTKQVSSPSDNYKKGVSIIVEDLYQQMNKEEFGRLFNRINNRYSDVVLNIVWTAEERQRVQTIKKKFEKLSPETQDKVLNGGGADVIAEMELQAVQMQAEIEALKRKIKELGGETLQIDAEYDNGISEEDMIAASVEAQLAVQSCLEAHGFDYSNVDNPQHYSTVDGVTKDGVEYPLVVKSHKFSNGSFMISANQWLQLMKPNSLLAVHTGNGNVSCLKLQDLLQTQDKLTFSFNIDNLDKANRIGDFAQILHYFSNVQFNFGHLNTTQYTRVNSLAELRFDERNHVEAPVVGNDNLL